MDFERREQQSLTPEDDSWSKKLQGILAEHGLLPAKKDIKPKKSNSDVPRTINSKKPVELNRNLDMLIFQEIALNYLEELEMVERKKDYTVVDIEKLKTFTLGFVPAEGRTPSKRNFPLGEKRFKEVTEDLKPHFDFYGGRVSDFLFSAFYGKKVLSKEDWSQNQNSSKKSFKPKSLFYSPENTEAAFDVDKIRQSDFYIGVWEVQVTELEGDYSSFHKGLPKDEASLACLIYSPKYGDGQRGAPGNLVVRYKDGKKRKITQEWLEDSGIGNSKKMVQEGSIVRSPRFALQKGAMLDMQNQGLIYSDDFQSLVTREENQKFNIKRPLNNRVAAVTLNDKIRYTIGVDYGAKKNKSGETKYFAHQISEKIGGVTEIQDDGSEKIVAVFDLLKPGDSRLKKVVVKNTEYFSANKEDINLRPYNASERIFDIEQSRNENVDFSAHLKAKQELVRMTGISLESLSAQEQKAFTDFFNSSDPATKNKLYEFAKKFLVDGLRTFLALQFDPEAAKKIFNIADSYSSEQATVIFQKYCGLLDRAGRVDEELREFFTIPKKSSQEDKLNASFEIMRRAGVVLTASSQNQDVKATGLVERLDSINDDLITFAALFKASFKGKSNMDFALVRGMDVRSAQADEIDSRLKEDMVKLAEENYPLEPQVPREIKQKLEGNDKNITFSYITKIDSAREPSLIAYLRIDKKNDGSAYLGSFNVNSKLRGSAVGEQLLAETIKQLHAEYDITAVVIPEIEAGTHYVEKTVL